MPSSTPDWPALLLQTGGSCLTALGPRVDAADPHGSVRARSRLLCAALAQISLECHAALGGEGQEVAIAEAGALLALLTKIDDQVIDGPGFHGGADTDRGELRARTRAHLAPTLRSLHDATPATDEPRCTLAAELGARLRALTHDRGRLDHLLGVIDHGWSIQVDAVATFSAHPATVTATQVSHVSAQISGAWLLMIGLVGTLPASAARPLHAHEERAFFGWGLPIQRADALADLARDLGDGLIATECGKGLWDAGRGVSRLGDPAMAYRWLAELDLDRYLLPAAGEVAELSQALADLGRVHSLLGWIHGFLLRRYLDHPLCQRATGDDAFATYTGDGAAFSPYHAGLSALGTRPYPGGEER